MKTNAIFLAGGALCALGLATPLASQGGKDAALEAACRATEVTAPDSCPCTIAGARKTGLNDRELASLFEDDGHSQPVDQAKYGRFWQVKSQCIADATMAKMGITPGNPLPGVPANMRPGAPFPPANTPVPPIARPGRNAPPAPVAAAATAQLSQPGQRTLAEVEAMIASLRGTAWEYTESKADGGTWHRYDFLADSNLVIYRSGDRKNAGDRASEVVRISAEQGDYGAFIRTHRVDSGTPADLPIIALSDSMLTYQKRYVRSGDEWQFRKVGQANADFPASGPQPLDDGFWRVSFNRIAKNPLVMSQARLSGFANAANREIETAQILDPSHSLYLIVPTDLDGCSSRCVLVLNDFDRRARQMRRRLIEESGVDFVGIRVEPGNARDPAASVRAYDGLGGWTEWRCTQGAALDCRKTGEQAPQAVATTGTGNLAGRLGPVKGDIYGEAQCSTSYFLAPADRSIMSDLQALVRYRDSNRGSLIATLTDLRGGQEVGLRLRIDGRERVLPSSGPESWGADGISFTFRATGEAIYDNPAWGFTPGRAILSVDGVTQDIEVVQYGEC